MVRTVGHSMAKHSRSGCQEGDSCDSCGHGLTRPSSWAGKPTWSVRREAHFVALQVKLISRSLHAIKSPSSGGRGEESLRVCQVDGRLRHASLPQWRSFDSSMLEPEPVQGEEAGTQRSRQSRCGTGRMQASKIVGLWLTARCAVVPCASSALLCHGKS